MSLSFDFDLENVRLNAIVKSADQDIFVLQAELIQHRRIIRWHRDQKGDDRCWLDDFLVWKQVLGAPDYKEVAVAAGGRKFDAAELRHCEFFYEKRNAEVADVIPEGVDAEVNKANREDTDLEKIDKAGLAVKILELKKLVYAECEKTSRTADDDRILYSILPEKDPADFRLPPREEFLGRAKAGAGCQHFFDSHRGCGALCNLHHWGPCTMPAAGE